MLTYAKFSVLKLFRRRSAVIVLTALFLGITIIYLFNLRSSATNNIAAIAQSSVESVKSRTGSEEHSVSGKRRQRIVKYYNSKQWRKMAKEKLAENNSLIELIKQQDGGTSQLLQVIQHENVVMNYIRETGVEPVNQASPVDGIHFMLRIMQDYFTRLFLIVLIFFLAPGVNSPFGKGRINRERLWPKAVPLLTMIRLCTLIATTILVYLTMLIWSFVIGSLLGGRGDWQYPVVSERAGQIITQSTFSVFTKAFVLQLMGLLSVVLILQLLAYLFRSENLTALFALLLIMVQVFTPSVFVFLSPIAHLIPGIYYNAVDAVTGQLSAKLHNSQINYPDGILVLLFFIVVLFVLTLAGSWYDNRSINEKRVVK